MVKNKEVSVPQKAVLLGFAEPNVRGSAHGNCAAQFPDPQSSRDQRIQLQRGS